MIDVLFISCILAMSISQVLFLSKSSFDGVAVVIFLPFLIIGVGLLSFGIYQSSRIIREFVSLINISYFIIVLTWASTLYDVFRIRRIKQQTSQLMRLSLLLYLSPLLIGMSVYALLMLISGDVTNTELVIRKYHLLIATISPVPLLPYLRKQHMHLSALPRE